MAISSLAVPDTELHPHWVFQGRNQESVPGHFQLLVTATFLGSWRHHSNLCLCLHAAFPPRYQISLCLSLMRTLVITLGPVQIVRGTLPISKSLISSHLDVVRGDHSAYPPSIISTVSFWLHKWAIFSMERGNARKRESLRVIFEGCYFLFLFISEIEYTVSLLSLAVSSTYNFRWLIWKENVNM